MGSGLRPLGGADGAHRPGSSNLRRDFPVAARLPIGDGGKRVQHRELERRAARFQAEVERPALAGEILVELSRGLTQ